MANKTHLEILKQGAEVWNKWRRRPYRITANCKVPHLNRIDLSHADLSGADLSGADLSGADLRRADLREVGLTVADLDGSDLSGADLRESHLSGAYLRAANLTRTILCGANLSTADLRDANLKEADLRGAYFRMADLRGANLSKTVFTPEGPPIGRGSFLELSMCYGLETAQFSSPDFLLDYLTKAFRYAHNPEGYERDLPDILEYSINNITALRRIYANQPAPQQLIEVVYTITAELIKYLKKHPKALYKIKPRQFEELIAEILASYEWHVQLTPPIRDGGYDIFAISKNIPVGMKTSWIIECKKYAPENRVGVDIVRALYGVKHLVGATNAMLATTSFFTRGAEAIKSSCYDMELKDYQDILEWINEYRPNPEGKLYIKDNKLVLPND